MTRHNFFRKLVAALMLGTMIVPMGLAVIPHPAYAQTRRQEFITRMMGDNPSAMCSGVIAHQKSIERVIAAGNDRGNGAAKLQEANHAVAECLQRATVE
jgi:hypothetical protein